MQIPGRGKPLPYDVGTDIAHVCGRGKPLPYGVGTDVAHVCGRGKPLPYGSNGHFCKYETQKAHGAMHRALFAP